MIADGFLREVEGAARETSRGRPPVALEVVPEALRVVGVKLSDETHTAVLTDLAGNLLARLYLHTNNWISLVEKYHELINSGHYLSIDFGFNTQLQEKYDC